MQNNSLNTQDISSDQLAEQENCCSGTGRKDFQYFWTLEGDFIEEINRSGKDGWSGVIVAADKISENSDSERKICIKKQENYFSYSSINFIRGRLTIENEAKNLKRCLDYGLTVPGIIFYGKREDSGKRQGILVTQFLDGFTPLDKILCKGEHELRCSTKLRRGLIDKVACEVRKLHKCKVIHNNLYPKHIFIDCETMKVAFIDFEKAKKKISEGACQLRDLEVLSRYTPMISRSDKLRFLKIYFGVSEFTEELRRLWRRIAKVEEKKLKRKKRHSRG